MNANTWIETVFKVKEQNKTLTPFDETMFMIARDLVDTTALLCKQ